MRLECLNHPCPLRTSQCPIGQETEHLICVALYPLLEHQIVYGQLNEIPLNLMINILPTGCLGGTQCIGFSSYCSGGGRYSATCVSGSCRCVGQPNRDYCTCLRKLITLLGTIL